MASIIRTQEQIDAVLAKAAQGEAEGSEYPSATFEEGVRAMWEWLTGYTDNPPFEGKEFEDQD